MNIQKSLKKAGKTTLAGLVEELYGMHEDVDEIIERCLATTSDKKDTLYVTIQHQLQHIQSDSEYIDYYESGSYAARLLSLLTDIDTLLRKHDPQQALVATEKFIWLHESVFERADDSNGEIGGVFSEAMAQWLDIAAEVRSQYSGAENWPEKVLSFFDGNDYGVLDDVIRGSRVLLTDKELDQMALRFESQAQKALKQSKQKGYSSEVVHACIGLRFIAEAKRDMALFEKSYFISNATLNAMQLESVVAFALTVGDFDRAQYWLANPVWKGDPARFKALRNRLLELQGNTKELKKYLAEDFYQNPCAFHLENYWGIANKAEQKKLYQQLPLLVKSVDDKDDAVAMALVIKHFDFAESMLLEHGHGFTKIYYGILLEWLNQLNEKTHTLACIVCYRCLLTNLLDRGYAKAYHHGADYFHKLLKLDKQVKDYKNLEDAQTYIRQLQSQHWRKRSFWEQANYPNKPV